MVEPQGEAGRLQEGNLEGISQEVEKIKEEFIYLSVPSSVAPPYSPPQVAHLSEGELPPRLASSRPHPRKQEAGLHTWLSSGALKLAG